MKQVAQQRGITLIGFLIGLCILGFFAYLAMRLIPMYTEYMGVVKSMELVRQEPGSAEKSLAQIQQSLARQFTVQYVYDVPLSAVSLARESGGNVMRISYERRVPFVYNLDLVGKFDKSMRLTNTGAE